MEGSEEIAEGKRADEPGTDMEPCNISVVDTAVICPVLTAPEEIGWPTVFTAALAPGVPVVTLVTNETIEEQTLATVVSGWLRTFEELPWKVKLPVETASAAAMLAFTVDAAAELSGGMAGGPRLDPSPLVLVG